MKRFALVTVSLLALATQPLPAQVLTPVGAARILITVNIGGEIPNGVTGYRVDTTCRGLANTTGGTQTIASTFPRTGGTVTVFFPVQAGSNCSFRLVIEGSGPRTLAGNSIFVGGTLRQITFPERINGVLVDPFGSIIESLPIPVEAATEVVIGQLPAPTTSTTTTTTTTTTRPPTTTTIAPTTAVTTTTAAARPPTSLAPAPPATPAPPPVTQVLATQPPVTVPTASTKAATTKKPATRVVRRCSTVKGKRVCRNVRVLVK